VEVVEAEEVMVQVVVEQEVTELLFQVVHL
jgi:hypothetical protein